MSELFLKKKKINHFLFGKPTFYSYIYDVIKTKVMDPIYRDEKLILKVGDVVTFSNDDILRESFSNSTVGGNMKDGLYDMVILTVKQYEWKEVYFEMTVSKLGWVLTEFELGIGDEEDEQANWKFTERAPYTFLRYMLNNVKFNLVKPDLKKS